MKLPVMTATVYRNNTYALLLSSETSTIMSSMLNYFVLIIRAWSEVIFEMIFNNFFVVFSFRDR